MRWRRICVWQRTTPTAWALRLIHHRLDLPAPPLAQTQPHQGDTMTVPQEAIDAAALVLAAVEGKPDDADLFLADDVLRAAAPHIAAAEREQRNGAYTERDQLVAALSKQFPSHLARHEGADWEDDWRNIVCVHLPAGQATWHIHDSELPWFSHLAMAGAHWDGHSTEEKYRRLSLLTEGTTT